MGPQYLEWVKQYQANDKLMTMLFVFGLILMGGYYGALLLPIPKPKIKWLQNIQAAMIIMIIVMTLAAPRLIDLGIIVME